jgi:hypothetical protein
LGTSLSVGALGGADLTGADLSDPREPFLTQERIEKAKGNKSTKLPSFLKRPAHWEVRDRIADLEQQRFGLEEGRRHARRLLGGSEGDPLEEAEVKAKLQEISQQIDDLRASLE